MKRTLSFAVGILCAAGFGTAVAQDGMVLNRGEATISLEPYAPNVVRVTLSLRKEEALGKPGYGIIATTHGEGWTHQSGEAGDVLQSSRMVISVRPERSWTPTGTQADIAKFFNGSTPGVGITFKTPEGKTLLDMHGWEMSVPNHKDADAGVLNDRRPSDPDFFRVGATECESVLLPVWRRVLSLHA